MTANPTSDELARANEQQRQVWRDGARHYDVAMRFLERVLFGDARAWAAAHATGNTLEVAVGTALNLPYYPAGVTLTGVDLSPEMLAIGRDRGRRLGRAIDMREGDAHALAFPDSSFDTMVCTFSLCNIPDQRHAVAEMHRVLKPGGRLVLVDHVASSKRVARAIQRGLERVSVPLAGEHLTRRPYDEVVAAGFAIESHQRTKLGIVERLTARKPDGA